MLFNSTYLKVRNFGGQKISRNLFCGIYFRDLRPNPRKSVSFFFSKNATHGYCNTLPEFLGKTRFRLQRNMSLKLYRSY